MARHPTARRVRREAEPEDAFVARVLQVTAWAKQHARLLTFAAIALVTVAAGTLYYTNYRRTLYAQSEIMLSEIRQTVEIGNRVLAMQDLERLLSDFGGTPAAREGRLLLALLHLEEDQPARAAEVVAPVARDVGDGQGTSAAFLLAAAYEAQGEPVRAEEVLLRIADRARLSYERREALDHAARLRLDRGDAAGAAELYDRLVSITPEDSPDRSIYEMRRAEAMVLAEAPAGVPAATPAPAGDDAGGATGP